MANFFTNILGTVLGTFGVGPQGTRATLSQASLSTNRTLLFPDGSGTFIINSLTGQIIEGRLNLYNSTGGGIGEIALGDTTGQAGGVFAEKATGRTVFYNDGGALGIKFRPVSRGSTSWEWTMDPAGLFSGSGRVQASLSHRIDGGYMVIGSYDIASYGNGSINVWYNHNDTTLNVPARIATGNNGGISMGSNTVVGSDLSKHIAMFGSAYGLNVVSGAVQMIVNTVARMSWGTSGVTMVGSLTLNATQPFSGIVIGTAAPGALADGTLYLRY